MSVSQPGKSTKTSAAVVAGVGVAAGVAALQNASATASGAPTLSSTGIVPTSVTPSTSIEGAAVSQVAAPVAAGPQIEELVQAYLGEGDVGALSAEALSAADLQDVLMDQDDLLALTEHPGVQVAQAGGGVGEFLNTMGGFVGGGAGAGAGLLAGGLLAGGLIIDEVSGSN